MSDKKKTEHLVKGMMESFPEASMPNLVCQRWGYDKWKYEFVDHEEDGKIHKLGKAQLLAAVPLMFTDKWLGGLTQVPANLLDGDIEAIDDWLCQADAFDFDAFVQLAIFGEVLYG